MASEGCHQPECFRCDVARERIKLIWARYGSGPSGETGAGSVPSILEESGSGGSSSSTIKRWTLGAQRWPLWNFSSQEKQSPCSRREASSSGVKRLTVGSGEGRDGEGYSGSKGERRGEEITGGGEGDGFTGWDRGGMRGSWSFSSCKHASPAAWTKVMGWRACTSRRISSARPDTKQLKRNRVGSPTMRLAKSLNSDR